MRLIVYGYEQKTGSYAAVRLKSGSGKGVVKRPNVEERRKLLKGGGGLRGEISQYTNASRQRFKQKVWAVQPALMPQRVVGNVYRYPASMITLTYPGGQGWEKEYRKPEECKRHLRTWWDRVRRKYPGAWAFWVMELQTREAHDNLSPAWHFHLLMVWPSPNTAPLRRTVWKERLSWISESWAQVVAGRGCKPDHDHEGAGTNVKVVKTPDDLLGYLAKGGTKESQNEKAQQKPDPEGGATPAEATGYELDAPRPAVAAVSELDGRRKQERSVDGPGRWWGILGACRIYSGGAGMAISQLCRSQRPGRALSSLGQSCPGSHCTINI